MVSFPHWHHSGSTQAARLANYTSTSQEVHLNCRDASQTFWGVIKRFLINGLTVTAYVEQHDRHRHAWGEHRHQVACHLFFFGFSKPLISEIFNKFSGQFDIFSWITFILTVSEYFVAIPSIWAFAQRYIVNGGMHIICNSKCISHEEVKVQPILTPIAFIWFESWGKTAYWFNQRHSCNLWVCSWSLSTLLANCFRGLYWWSWLLKSFVVIHNSLQREFIWHQFQMYWPTEVEEGLGKLECRLSVLRYQHQWRSCMDLRRSTFWTHLPYSICRAHGELHHFQNIRIGVESKLKSFKTSSFSLIIMKVFWILCKIIPKPSILKFNACFIILFWSSNSFNRLPNLHSGWMSVV